MNQPLENYNHLVLIDGVCNFCVASVRIIHKLDPQKILKVASQQDQIGQDLMAHYNLSGKQLDSIIYIEDGKAYDRSDAIIQMSKHFKQPYKMLASVMKIFPNIIRNSVYEFIARHRYKIFGKRDVCYLPEGDLSERFIENNADDS